MNNKTTSKQIERINKKILIGQNSDNNAIVLQLDTIGFNQPDPHFSISGNEYDLSQVFTEDEGQQRAEEQLENDDEYEYFWREAVAAEKTTLGLEDWKQDVLDIDGWESILGDVEYIDDGLYCMNGSGGQINIDGDVELEDYIITEKELKLINKAWNSLHLFSVDQMNKYRGELTDKEIDQMNEIVNIFKKYPEFENKQLKQFTE
jgi:hypothetical protein